MKAVRANVREGNEQISLATEDMFIWGQVHTDTPFYFPNREALLDLFADVVSTPGVEQHLLSHATIAPAVVDPLLIERLSDLLLPKSPIRVPLLSSHPEGRALVPLIGLETGSVNEARRIMPSKAIPFPIEEWPSVVIRGLEVLNKHNWFPAMTLIVGSPGETDEDCQATSGSDLRSGTARALCVLHSRHSSPRLHDTRLEHQTGVTETRQFTPLQWQLMMKCWKMNLRPGQVELVGPDGVESRRDRPLAVQASKAQWPALHLAADDVCWRRSRAVHAVDWQAVQRQAARDQDPQGTSCYGQAQSLEAPACRHRRRARGCAAGTEAAQRDGGLSDDLSIDSIIDER